MLEFLAKLFGYVASTPLKPYININTGLKTKAKIYFEKVFLKLMNNSVLKSLENLRKCRYIKLIAT